MTLKTTLPQLSPETVRQTHGKEIEAIARYRRVANYLAAAQLYLKSNVLLEEPLRPEHIKDRLLGHWVTVPVSTWSTPISMPSSGATMPMRSWSQGRDTAHQPTWPTCISKALWSRFIQNLRLIGPALNALSNAFPGPVAFPVTCTLAFQGRFTRGAS